jgi:hypothetical protein
MNVIHVVVSGHNRKVREAVADAIRETMMVHGFDINVDPYKFPPAKYNPFAVLHNAPDTEIRVEER